MQEVHGEVQLWQRVYGGPVGVPGQRGGDECGGHHGLLGVKCRLPSRQGEAHGSLWQLTAACSSHRKEKTRRLAVVFRIRI